MGRRGDNTGVDQTCPYINEVRDFLEGIEWDEDEAKLEKGAKEACIALEKVRKMNEELRDFGNRQYEYAAELEKDRDYYKDQCQDLEKQVENLKEELIEAYNAE